VTREIKAVIDPATGLVYGIETKYSADQPRVPAGGPGGGEFGAGGGMVMSSHEARRRGIPPTKLPKAKFRVSFHNVEKGGIRAAYSASIHVNGVHVGYVQRERGDPAYKAISHTGLVMSRARELSDVRDDIQSAFEEGEVPMPETS
jgi:hypothetical protein